MAPLSSTGDARAEGTELFSAKNNYIFGHLHNRIDITKKQIHSVAAGRIALINISVSENTTHAEFGEIVVGSMHVVQKIRIP